MKARWILFTIVTLGAGLLFHGHVGADQKKTKEPEKKKTEPAKPIVVEGELINADLKDKVQQNSFSKSYTFRMEKDKSYQIDLYSRTFRPFLRLENSNGNAVATDFDQFGQGGPATIIHRASKTEDFQIVATTINPNAVGKFTVTVKELTGKEGAPIELKFEKGRGVFQGNLGQADPRYAGKIHKLFIVKMEQGKTYQIDHMSRDFDAYLYLQDPNGTVLAQDDDGGEGLNSRIIHRANKTGEFRIVATSLGGRSVGAFTFQVTEKK
jgi:hypothetical protein